MECINEDDQDSYLNINNSLNHHKINPDCPVCSKPVFWKRHFLSADRAWHVNCFHCCHCFKSLKPGEQSFYRGKIFCTEPCFNKLFSITDVQTNVNNKIKEEKNKDKKCLHCFKLNQNTNKTELKNKITDINKPLPIAKFFGNNCTRCSKPVYAAELCYSINFPWHLNCLRCSNCKRTLQPAAHAVHNGLPICNFPCYIKIYSSNGYRKGWQECRP